MVASCGLLVCLLLASMDFSSANPKDRQDRLESVSQQTRPNSLKLAFVPHPPPVGVRIVNAFLTDNGDADGWADTNETVDMRLTVHNGMGVDLTGLTARLTTEDPRIECITDAALKIGNLDDGETRVTTDVFTFTVADVSRIAVGQEFSVAFEEPLGAACEVFVLSDPFDLGREGIDDQGIDTRALNPGNGLSVLGEVIRQTDGGLLRHDLMISRYRENTTTDLDQRRRYSYWLPRLADVMALGANLGANGCGLLWTAVDASGLGCL